MQTDNYVCHVPGITPTCKSRAKFVHSGGSLKAKLACHPASCLLPVEIIDR